LERKRKDPDNAMKKKGVESVEVSSWSVPGRPTDASTRRLSVWSRGFSRSLESSKTESEGGDVKQAVARVLKKAVRTKRKRTTR